MFKDNKPNLKRFKFESSDNAIKRGIIVQTSFISKREKKAKLKDTEVPQNVGGQDCYGADDAHQLRILKFLNRQQAK